MVKRRLLLLLPMRAPAAKAANAITKESQNHHSIHGEELDGFAGLDVGDAYAKLVCVSMNTAATALMEVVWNLLCLQFFILFAPLLKAVWKMSLLALPTEHLCSFSGKNRSRTRTLWKTAGRDIRHFNWALPTRPNGLLNARFLTVKREA